MRFPTKTLIPLVAILLVANGRADAQISAQVNIGAAPRAWGHERVIMGYNASRYGDWKTNYRRWSPVTLYFHDGRYFDRQVKGSRAVVVYKYHNDYFFPPQEPGWDKTDRRYKYEHKPMDEDYARAHSRP